MSRLRELIEELAPGGVPHRELGTLGKRNKGTSITAARMKVLARTPGPVRVFAGGQTIADVAEDAVPPNHVVRVPSIIVKSRGNVGFSYYDKPFTHKSELWSYSISEPEVRQKFVYYFLLSQAGRLQETARANSVKIPQLSVKDTDSLRVPIPPLAVQDEVVRLLDELSKCHSDLEPLLSAEIDARKAQHEYLRRELMNEKTREASWHLLGDVAVVKTGQAPAPGVPLATGAFPFVNAGTSSSGWSFESNSEADTITIPSRGQGGVGVVGYQFAPFWCGPLCYRVTSARDDLTNRFLYHYLKSIQPEIRGLQQTGGTPALNRKELVLLKVPVPSAEIQRSVVAMLDQLDTLYREINLSLPLEISARRQQYEYYRDMLLTFPELSA